MSLRHRLSALAFGGFGLAALVATSGTARADATETERQIAQTLFEEGRALLEQKRYAEACPKLAESQRLDPGGGTLLNLALCHELEGRTATAWTELKEALGQAVRDERDDRAQFAREHIAAIEPRLVRVVVVVPDSLAARGPSIALDGSILARAAWGAAIPVDPGAHRVAVEVTGAPRWESSVDAREDGRTYRIEVPALEPPGPVARPPEDRVRSRAFWIVLGGAGVALAGSAVTGLLALDADAYVRDNCIPARDFCRVADADDAASRARTYAWISTAALGVAAAAALTAFVLPRETRTRIAVTPGGARVTF